MFYIGIGSSSALAGQILLLDDQEPRCIITRSSGGVNDALIKVQSLIQSSTKVATPQLEDPGTRVFRFRPTSTSYSVDDLRRIMGLADVLEDKILLTADYRDRYFEKQNGHYAQMFAQLLTGPWLNSKSLITVHTNQLREEFQNDHDLTRQAAIQLQLNDYPNFSLRWRNYDAPGPKLEHARTLKLVFADLSTYLVTFDKGLDFVRRTWRSDEFEVSEKTYLMIEPG
jgi:hypothetical protein